MSSKWWVPSSVAMGDGQGRLEELLVALRLRNRAGGNGAARAGECGVCGGEFFPTLTGGPFAREERVTGGPTACGAQVAAVLRISDRIRRDKWVGFVDPA
jgi:hypothetical protein